MRERRRRAWGIIEHVRFVLVALAIVLLALVADRLLLAAEARGWIYWRKRKASPGTAASAMLEVQSILEPGRAHVAEAARAEETDEDDAGDDDR